MQKPKKTREPVRYSIDDPSIGSPWEDAIFVEGGTLPNPQPPVPQVIDDEISRLHAQHRQDVQANPGYVPTDFGVDENTGMPSPTLAGSRGILRDTWDGLVSGFTYQQQDPNSKYNDGRYSRSLLDDAWRAVRSKPQIPVNVPVVEGSKAFDAAYNVGRVIGDGVGFGTQSKFWNIHPLDVASTQGFNFLKGQSIDPRVARLGAYSGALALGVGSNNFNPFNVMEGGRQTGFEAISADENDPRQSTNPVMDMVFHRGMLGRTGKLLPWEQFSQERPNVSYDQYEAYKEYLRDPGMLGLVKGTWDGVDGAEARIMGYRVTPLGVASALGTLGAVAGIAKLAGRRK
jgi:hypothetical protein